jgi:hypothetical protein
MPINQAQLINGANYQLESWVKNDPVDNVDKKRPLLQWLIQNSKPAVYSNGILNEKVRISHDSNYQNYTGDQQVTYNRRDSVRKAPYQHYEAHDGFSLNETDLANNGIVMTKDTESVPTEAEATQVVNILKENYDILKLGFQENIDIEFHLDGSANPLSVPGLDALVSTTPATGVIGGLDASVYTFWRNTAILAINSTTAGLLVSQMETAYRACTTYGGMEPDYIVCGSAFYDAYRTNANLTQNRQVIVTGKDAPSADGGTDNVYFKGKLVVWDPTFDALDAILGVITYPWAKRCYFLQSKSIKLRQFKGRWMIMRNPSPMYDRYVHYWGLTADYGITCNQRNTMAVLSIL